MEHMFDKIQFPITLYNAIKMLLVEINSNLHRTVSYSCNTVTKLNMVPLRING